MRKTVIATAVVAFFVMAIAFSARAYEDVTRPPQVQEGWNLISAPCDISLETLRQKLDDGGLNLYEWTGDTYAEVPAMQRGRGYFMSMSTAMKQFDVCDATQNGDLTVSFNAGWNLLGNPYNFPSIFSKLVGAAADSIADSVFTYEGGALRQLNKYNGVSPWRGYWIYTKTPVTVTFTDSRTCESIAVSRLSPAGEIAVGDKLRFTAICIVGTTVQTITSEARWSSSNSAVAVPSEEVGFFDVIAAGDSDIIASFGKTTGKIAITVPPPAGDLVKLELKSSLTSVYLDQWALLTVTGTYKDGTTRELTDKVKFEFGTEGVGEIEGKQFLPRGVGNTTLTASLPNIKSNTIDLSVLQQTLTTLTLTIDKKFIQISGTAQLKLSAGYDSGRTMDAISQAEWHVQTAGLVDITEGTGTVHPLGLGTLWIYATLDGVESNKVTLTIGEKTLMWIKYLINEGQLRRLPCPQDPKHEFCYTNFAMKVGDTGRFDSKNMGNTYGYYSDGSGHIYDDGDLAWDISDKNVLKEKYGDFTAIKEGLTGVRGYREGLYSEWHWVYAFTDSTMEFLLLETSSAQTVVEKGKTINIGTTYFKRYVSWFDAFNVTNKAEWVVSNPDIGTMTNGVFTATAAGDVKIYAVYNGVKSNAITIRVWEPSHLQYCDENNVNETVWSDGVSFASLETNCNSYNRNENISIRFLAELESPSRWSTMDVCMDMYVYDKNQKLIRTFQDRNCSPAPLFRAHEGYVPVYDYTAAWDQKDSKGQPVPPGEYTAIVRFYILYCPVIRLKINIQ